MRVLELQGVSSSGCEPVGLGSSRLGLVWGALTVQTSKWSLLPWALVS